MPRVAPKNALQVNKACAPHTEFLWVALAALFKEPESLCRSVTEMDREWNCKVYKTIMYNKEAEPE